LSELQKSNELFENKFMKNVQHKIETEIHMITKGKIHPISYSYTIVTMCNVPIEIRSYY